MTASTVASLLEVCVMVSPFRLSVIESGIGRQRPRMMLRDEPAIRGIDVRTPSDVSSIRCSFDVGLSQINAPSDTNAPAVGMRRDQGPARGDDLFAPALEANAAMMAEPARWHAQGKIKPVINRATPMSELKSAYAPMGSQGVMGTLAMVN